jgi:hypothetical protein
MESSRIRLFYHAAGKSQVYGKYSGSIIKTNPYRLVILILFNPLAVRYVPIVLCVARDEDSLISLCRTLEIETRVRVVRLPRSPGPQLLSHSTTTNDNWRSPGESPGQQAVAFGPPSF